MTFGECVDGLLSCDGECENGCWSLLMVLAFWWLIVLAAVLDTVFNCLTCGSWGGDGAGDGVAAKGAVTAGVAMV